MTQSKSFLSILIPAVTVFISSACIMVLELVAGRLVAKDLGSSLYTWTSIIGIVLAGITVNSVFLPHAIQPMPQKRLPFGNGSLCLAGC